MIFLTCEKCMFLLIELIKLTFTTFLELSVRNGNRIFSKKSLFHVSNKHQKCIQSNMGKCALFVWFFLFSCYFLFMKLQATPPIGVRKINWTKFQVFVNMSERSWMYVNKMRRDPSNVNQSPFSFFINFIFASVSILCCAGFFLRTNRTSVRLLDTFCTFLVYIWYNNLFFLVLTLALSENDSYMRRTAKNYLNELSAKWTKEPMW